jgi:glycosyltransferase 2 family protein
MLHPDTWLILLMVLQQKKLSFWLIIIAAGVSGLILMYLFRKQFSNKPFIGKIYSIFRTFRDGLLSLFKIKKWPLFIIYTILIWFCYLMMTWLCFLSLEDTMHLSIVAAFASVTFGTIGIMVVQGGIGVYPAIVAETLLIFGIISPIGYAMGWITWITQTVILLIMGLWAVLYLFFYKGIKIDDIRKDQTEDTDTASIV